MILRTLHNKRGQGVAVEYAVLFFILVAVMVGMTTYVRRTVQGRVHDARQYSYAQVNALYRNYYPDKVLPNGYEPYYLHTKADKAETSVTLENDYSWAGHEGKYENNMTVSGNSKTTSNVLPAHYAD